MTTKFIVWRKSMTCRFKLSDIYYLMSDLRVIYEWYILPHEWYMSDIYYLVPLSLVVPSSWRKIIRINISSDPEGLPLKSLLSCLYGGMNNASVNMNTWPVREPSNAPAVVWTMHIYSWVTSSYHEVSSSSSKKKPIKSSKPWHSGMLIRRCVNELECKHDEDRILTDESLGQINTVVRWPGLKTKIGEGGDVDLIFTASNVVTMNSCSSTVTYIRANPAPLMKLICSRGRWMVHASRGHKTKCLLGTPTKCKCIRQPLRGNW